mmetsp:Transcript_5086/g.5915  ORF Transcript_5086/g.5915 Transcript_5086/m.5915 type:complete len:458 (+) Transcript_5086:14-1387(+)
MAPQCFNPYPSQPVGAGRQHQVAARMHRPGPPPRISPTTPGPAPFPRLTSNGRQFPPPPPLPGHAPSRHVQHMNGRQMMHPVPKGRAFPLRPPLRRIPPFANDRPRHHPPQHHHTQQAPEICGRVNNLPPMRRPLPPLNGMNHPMQQMRPHPRTQMSAPSMSTQSLQHRQTGQSGPLIHHAPPPSLPSSPMQSHSDSPQVPLRELSNQNTVPSTVSSSIYMHKVHQLSSENIMIDQARKQPNADADAAEILLGLRALTTPPPPPATSPKEKSDTTPELTATPKIELPKSLPTRLAVAEDESKLNSMHCFLRSDLLELFVVERSKNKNANEGSAAATKLGYKIGSASGRVGLRCVHCAKARVKKNMSSEGEAPMAVFYPKSISELYRLVTSWQRVHLRKCHNLPPSVREMYEKTREDKSRGKTQWWVDSAREIGLIDCTMKAGGIRFASAPNGLLGGF